MERCGAPCEGRQSVHDYAQVVEAAAVAMCFDARPVVDALARRMGPLVADERFEEAVTHRDRLRALLAASARSQRLRALGGSPELVAARLTPEGGWEVAVIRHGRLAAAGLAVRGVAPKPFIAALRAAADPVAASPGDFPTASAEEAECLLRWLDSPGVRLVHLDGVWASPRHGSRGLESGVSLTTPSK
jgi:DNA polymerase-3 subunit epsilon